MELETIKFAWSAVLVLVTGAAAGGGAYAATRLESRRIWDQVKRNMTDIGKNEEQRTEDIKKMERRMERTDDRCMNDTNKLHERLNRLADRIRNSLANNKGAG